MTFPSTDEGEWEIRCTSCLGIRVFTVVLAHSLEETTDMRHPRPVMGQGPCGPPEAGGDIAQGTRAPKTWPSDSVSLGRVCKPMCVPAPADRGGPRGRPGVKDKGREHGEQPALLRDPR